MKAGLKSINATWVECLRLGYSQLIKQTAPAQRPDTPRRDCIACYGTGSNLVETRNPKTGKLETFNEPCIFCQLKKE